MADLLFEIGVEELPAGAIDPALLWMAEAFLQHMSRLGITCGPVLVEGTPRRLVLIARGLPEKQPDRSEEITGPKAEVAFDASGKLTKAGEGFVLSKGHAPAAAYRKQTPKGEVIALLWVQKGASLAELLPPVLSEMLQKIPFAKRMRWEPSQTLFARPVRWLVALLGEQHLPVTFADVTSGTCSYGHRFLSPEAFVVKSADQYVAELSKRFVMLERNARKVCIQKEGEKLAASVSGAVSPDEALLETQKNLVEYPWPVMGSFEKAYLDIPQEILVSEMRGHQKYSAVIDAQGALLPFFITVLGSRSNDVEFSARGNARVLRARFEDGAFYFYEDQKKPLAEHAKGLSSLVFERALGSMAEKVERIKATSCALADLIELPAQVLPELLRAASLAKADLQCGVVKEFPELQGVMGRIYAQKGGELPTVAAAIEQHYWPRFAKDHLPKERFASIIALADRLDTLVGIMGIDKGPKGSADPFGLRRAAIAICRIIIHEGYRFSLRHLLGLAIDQYGDRFAKKKAALLFQCETFVVGRLRGLLLEDLAELTQEEAITALVDGALAVGCDDATDVWARILALKEMRAKNVEQFERLSQTFKRAQNIVHKARESGHFSDQVSVDLSLLTHPAEQALGRLVEQAQGVVQRDMSKETDKNKLCAHYRAVFDSVVKMKPELDAFFDSVMVMCEEEALRNARLGLLQRIERVSLAIADFKKLS